MFLGYAGLGRRTERKRMSCGICLHSLQTRVSAWNGSGIVLDDGRQGLVGLWYEKTSESTSCVMVIILLLRRMVRQ